MNIDFYRNSIDSKNFIIIDEPTNSLNSMTMFVSIAEKRDELQKYLSNYGIQSLIYYGRPLHLQTASVKLGINQGEFPNAELLSSKVLTIPFHQYLTNDELKHVSQTVNNFYSNIKI
jgi:dTDP-4-amino-4,6-dideoxygalactose transaminase